MRHLVLISLIGFVAFALTGCAAKGKLVKIERERVDQEIAPGENQGYLFGTPPPPAPRKGTREYFEFRVEIPPVTERESKAPQVPKEKEEESRGTPIYVAPEMPEKEDVGVVTYEEERPGPEMAREEYVNYTVQKGDTLQKISMKFYGTAKKWHKIFLANEDRLKSPDKVYPGQVLKIPQGTAVTPPKESEYIK